MDRIHDSWVENKHEENDVESADSSEETESESETSDSDSEGSESDSGDDETDEEDSSDEMYTYDDVRSILKFYRAKFGSSSSQ